MNPLLRTVSFLAFSGLLAAACSPSATSSSGSGATSISGTVGGSTLNALSVVANYGTMGTSTVNGVTTNIRGLRIFVSDKANTCATFHSANATIVDIAVRGDAVSPGTYKVIDPVKSESMVGDAEADFIAVDAACKGLVQQPSASGTITITESGTRIAGTLDITFAGGKVTGSFDAELCPAPQTTDAGTPAQACTP